MQNILILADGLPAEEFIKRIGQKRVGDNHYCIVMPHAREERARHSPHLDMRYFDPTSYMKLRKLLQGQNFSTVFVLLENDEEGEACLEIIRSVDTKMQVILLNQRNDLPALNDSATHVVDTPQIIASRLYDHLPNVPVVAQNVGLAQGEIMEVLVPYGSSFAYRHIGSIAQVKWRIAAIYREQKQILPTNATMIQPQDTLLILGKPQVLNNIYHRISKKEGRFPEPFGRYLYLILDMRTDASDALAHLKESIHLLDRVEEGKLFVRLLNPGDFPLLDEIRGYDNGRIDIHVQYGDDAVSEVILNDMIQFDIGMLMMTPQLFSDKAVADEMMGQRKLVMLFGDSPLYSVERSVVLVSGEEEMESISSTLFYASETLDLKPCLCNYDPEGDFESKKMVVEHYETLARIFQYPVTVEEKTVNPIRALESMEYILQVVPFTRALQEEDIFKIFSTRISDYLLDSTRHPKLLIPVES
jgi:hypothetical protein